MSSQKNQTNEPAHRKLGAYGYIVVDDARCYYKPEVDAAVRVIPPYGTLVGILRQQDGWVLVSFCGKEAWSPIEQLAAEEPKAKVLFDIRPYLFPGRSNSIASAPNGSDVEIGPRGGRFTRTKSGFRRYF
ncbi:hypothetical protein [Novosphingobium sp. LASN5T]|uniref:hypothetical protein n=1 Tax=Novosphingobium sp. LASN5T TaxID=2491021 RepID=UPI000F5D7DAC|nr:hypothetical protein [Novosphingobium sp. LASN5T]RQW46070.1 hypothetical protein EH199_01515 [Novosphingobium sp. LASN5T]